MDPEYVTEQINSHILELQKITTTKDILAIYKCRYCIEWLL